MRFTIRSLVLALVLSAMSGILDLADAQVGERLRQRARERVQQGVDRAVGGSEEKEQKPAENTGSAPAGYTSGSRPGEASWTNYDFVPGERVILAEDFSRDRVGNFPQRFEFRSGSIQIVEWQSRRWLSAQGGEFLIKLPEALPTRYTIEFELAGHGNPMEIRFEGPQANAETRLELATWMARLRVGNIDAQGDLPVNTQEHPVTIRIAADGDYFKLYANERRVLNVPNAKTGRPNQIKIDMNGQSAEKPRMIADLRIAAGGRALYDALVADGRVATQGILFDVGSDRIRPESTPTLREIADMLKQNPSLRLRIEGHTDNVGQAATNQALSEKRAAAVRAHLVGQMGIDASRLESQGLGSSKPLTGNDTPEGRQQNRRVELVRM
jgi:OmpA-OmpF porin, OOP family